MLHSLSKDTAFTRETAPRHTFLCSDSQCLPPGDPRILCAKHGYPITGRSFIPSATLPHLYILRLITHLSQKMQLLVVKERKKKKKEKKSSRLAEIIIKMMISRIGKLSFKITHSPSPSSPPSQASLSNPIKYYFNYNYTSIGYMGFKSTSQMSTVNSNVNGYIVDDLEFDSKTSFRILQKIDEILTMVVHVESYKVDFLNWLDTMDEVVIKEKEADAWVNFDEIFPYLYEYPIYEDQDMVKKFARW